MILFEETHLYIIFMRLFRYINYIYLVMFFSKLFNFSLKHFSDIIICFEIFINVILIVCTESNRKKERKRKKEEGKIMKKIKIWEQ